MAVSARPALAGVSGYMQFNYNISNEKTTDYSTGQSTQNRSTFFEQLYNLGFERRIYPNLQISGGGMFERDLEKTRPDGGGSATSSLDTFRPYAGVTLRASPFIAGLNYSEIRTTSGSSGNPSSTQIQDNYAANFMMTPYGLPPLRLSYSRYHTFDPTHTLTDLVSDTLSYSTFYSVLPVHLSYSGSYGVFTDKLALVTSKSYISGIVASYTNQMGPETSLNASYGIRMDRETTETSIQSGGFVYLAVNPYNAFSLKPDNIPSALQLQQSPFDMSNGNEALIDGNTGSPAVSANGGGVNLGTGGNPGPNSSLAYFYHMGVEFQDSPSANALFVYVDKDLSNIPGFNPDAVFSWTVYKSDDGLNWTPVALSSTASFKTMDPLGQPAFGFEIDLPGINAAWLQVVVSPLSNQDIITVPGSKAGPLANINVTELRTFERQQASQVNTTTQSHTDQNMSLGFSTIVLENPRLALTVNYVVNSLGTSSFSYLASGGLALQQSFRLSRTLTGTASFYTQEYRTRKGSSTMSLLYTTGLTWVPLPTLRSSMIYTGQTAFMSGLDQSNSIFLDNTAQLYDGINVYFNGGADFPLSANASFMFNAGAGITPYRTVSLTLNYSESIQSGQGGISTKTGGATLAYSPFNNLFLSSSVNLVSVAGLSSVSSSYNVGWSPLQGGLLQLNFGYNEFVDYSQNQGKSRSLSSSASIRITPTALLDAGYTIVKTDDIASETNVRTFSLQFRKMF